MNPRPTMSRNPTGRTPKRSSKPAVALFGCALLFGSPVVLAAPGDLDPTFGGIQTRYVSPGFPEPGASALQSDGKILLAGDIDIGTSTSPQKDMALLREGASGGADATFAGGGVATIHIGPYTSSYQSTVDGLAESPNGSILASGWDIDPGTGLTDAALLRYQANGSLDPTFGTGGGTFLAFSNASAKARGLALQHNLKPVVAGFVKVGTANSQLMVARYTSAGALDTSFGTGGMFVVPTTTLYWSDGFRVVVQPDGKIVVGGRAFPSSSDQYDSTVVVRLTANGVPDPTFGSGGYVVLHNVFCNGALALQPDGKIDVVSYSGEVTRLNTNGSIDTPFGITGTAWVGSYGSEIALLPTGQILLSTSVFNQQTRVASYQVTRFTPQGAADTTFRDSTGQSGIVSTAFNLGTISTSVPLTAGGGIAVGPDGKFTISGQATVNGTSNYFMMVRYTGDPLVLKPAIFKFHSVTGVPLKTVEVSDVITISGLTPGATVPVTVSGGRYSINGNPWVTTMGYAKNGDQIMVNHTSATISGGIVTTTLRVGGMHALNNNATALGGYVASTFTSTTK